MNDPTPYLHFLDVLGRENRLFCAKTHRVELQTALPLIPCLDHEAQLTGHPAPHISVYLQDAEGDLHEVGIVPRRKAIVVDVPSTLLETTPEARARFCAQLRQWFPDYAVELAKPSFVRADKRVAIVIKAQLGLREVLLGDDAVKQNWCIEKLRAISDLMEKESRVYSWGVRTMTPVLGGAGLASYILIGMFRRSISVETIELLRGATATVMSAAFLYYGLKAVYLTQLGTRVWKRATEYKLIIDARRRAKSV